ncbi:MAG: M23 family metallopeptidase [Actinomycetota bacterium]|nr:M23 family metallopeptidase [Actinomycetota bacterium]
MALTRAKPATLLGAVILALAACSSAADEQAVIVAVPTSTTTALPATTTLAPTTTAAVPPTRPAAPAAPAARAPARVPAASGVRNVTEQPWTPFATVGGITLQHPSSRVERVGFHEANHDGARQMEPLPSAVAPVTLESRGRVTASRTAADVVLDPGSEIRAPATGTVRVAGSYVLYCDYSDGYVIIEPDQHPGWQVKVLHIRGLRVGAGDRVTAGQTVLAGGPAQFPFQSQVDDVATADPPWPHTHIEVIDPSIPDIPSPGGGCN